MAGIRTVCFALFPDVDTARDIITSPEENMLYFTDRNAGVYAANLHIREQRTLITLPKNCTAVGVAVDYTNRLMMGSLPIIERNNSVLLTLVFC